VREEREVREVVVACEKREERSEAVVAVDWTDARAEGGRERGGGADVVGRGGGRRRVLVRETEELLAEGVSIGAGEITPDVMDEGDGEELCEVRPLAEPRGWE
jgi:hypothetical protein